MKKLLSLFIILLSTIQLNATHLMGGQITSHSLGGLTYEVTLTLYRDTNGIPAATSNVINFTDSFGTFIFSATAPASPAVNMGNGVEKYDYITIVTFPYYGTFNAYYNECCRNMAIINIPNAGNYSMYLDVQILVDSSNSSPTFLNDPITLAQLNQPFSYNPSPSDIDGDSLTWVMDIPMDYMSGMSSIIPGYSLPPSDTSMPFNLDTLTGEITFLPNTVGNFQISVKAIEWRNGVQIGYIRRDMQLIVIPSSNVPPIVSTSYSVLRSNGVINITPNQTFTFVMTTVDPDSQMVDVYPSGDIFACSTVPTLTNNYYSNSSVQSVLTWSPTTNEIRNRPYTICLRVREDYNGIIFYRDYSISLNVTNSTSYLEENNVNDKIIVYPNPTTNKLYFNYGQSNNCIIYLYDIDGKIIITQKVINGINSIDMNNLSTGGYKLSTSDGKINKTIIKN